MTSPTVHELFRYAKGDLLRIYSLHVTAGRTELWRVTEQPGQAPASIKETDLASADEAAAFIEEVSRTLRAGGWRELGGE